MRISYLPRIVPYGLCHSADIPRRLRIESLPEGSLRGLALGRGESPMVYTVMGGGASFGLRLAKMNPELGRYFSSDRGVLVLDVEEDSSLGLVPGDVILAIGDREVEDEGDVGRILGSYEDEEAVMFTLVRQGSQIRVEGSVG